MRWDESGQEGTQQDGIGQGQDGMRRKGTGTGKDGMNRDGTGTRQGKYEMRRDGIGRT